MCILERERECERELATVCACVCVYLDAVGGPGVDMQARGGVVGERGSAQSGWRSKAHCMAGVRQTCQGER